MRSPRSSGSLRPQTTTVAPASTKRVAMERPMPRLPPVTSTTRPVKSSGLSTGTFLLVHRGVIDHSVDGRGIAEVVMDNPPVNALSVAGWFELADLLTAIGRDPATRVVVLRAEGRGFNAGVDIKEMQNTSGFEALIGANRGCYAAFAAVYECAVPVIAAVHGYCLGGGIGLVGNADIVIASDDATF